MNVNQLPVTNYLVPAAGGTSCVEVSGVFSSTAYLMDWVQYALDNSPFTPQGVFIDNRLGTGDLTITINPIGYPVVCPAGTQCQAQFPAPNGQTCSITGLGQASVYFVNFPVLPNNGLINIGNQVSVSIDAIKAGLSLPVIVPTNSSGNPYQVTKWVLSPTLGAASITGTGTTASFTPPANSNLRALYVDLTDDASLTGGGKVTITCALNGVTVATRTIWLPGTSGGNLGVIKIFSRGFSDFAFNAGAAGTFNVTISAALTTGQLDFNAYFA